MPRPDPSPVAGRFGFGDGRASQFAALAAAATTSLRRESLKCRSRYATGSDFTCAAISSISDSCANEFCRRLGDRSGPVKNGDRIVCVRTRSLLTTPVPPQVPPTQPVTYDGAALLPLLKRPAGAGAGVRGANGAGSNPASTPVTPLPGRPLPGRPPQ